MTGFKWFSKIFESMCYGQSSLRIVVFDHQKHICVRYSDVADLAEFCSVVGRILFLGGHDDLALEALLSEGLRTR